MTTLAPRENMLQRFGGWFASAMSLRRFILAILGARFVLLALLFVALRGHEIGNDVRMHMHLVRSPLCVLTFGCPDYEQHPPFLPLMETALGYPLSLVFPDFLALRFVMIFFEIMVGALFYLLLDKFKFDASRKGLCLAAFLILPAGWMTTTVMSQDDSIGAAFILLPILLMASRRLAAAIFFCGIGFVAGKIFLMLELLTLLAFCPRQKLLKYAAIGFAPIAVIYGALAAHRIAHGFPLPLLGFHPDTYFGATFWMVLHFYAGVDFSKYGVYTGVLALAAAMIPASIVLSWNIHHADGINVPVAVTASMLTFFALFYHIEPEYLMLVFPLLIITVASMEDAFYCMFLSTIPWITKLLQLIVFQASIEETSAGKAYLIKIFTAVFHSSPDLWLALTQVLFSATALIYSVKLCMRLRGAPQASSPVKNTIADLHSQAE